MQAGAKDSRGFTLLEVMIALAIIAIALVTLLGLGNRSIGVNARLQRLTQGTLLAQEKMTELEVATEDGSGELQEGQGNFAAPFEGYRWRTTFAETPLAAVRIVTVTVAWGKEERNETVDLTSFVFRQGAAP